MLIDGHDGVGDCNSAGDDGGRGDVHNCFISFGDFHGVDIGVGDVLEEIHIIVMIVFALFLLRHHMI